ncbi:MAG: hypothetical protein WA874_05800 [Chryseosolibacter sp.]
MSPVLVPVDEVCQYHRTSVGGVPLHERVTLPHVFPDFDGVGGVAGGGVRETVMPVLAPQQPVVLL